MQEGVAGLAEKRLQLWVFVGGLIIALFLIEPSHAWVALGVGVLGTVITNVLAARAYERYQADVMEWIKTRPAGTPINDPSIELPRHLVPGIDGRGAMGTPLWHSFVGLACKALIIASVARWILKWTGCVTHLH